MPGSLSIEERVAYIQNLGNAEIALYSAGPIASANVVGGSTVAFLDGMDGGLRVPAILVMSPQGILNTDNSVS